MTSNRTAKGYDVDGMRRKAEQFAADARTQSAMQDALGNRRAAAEAIEDPIAFLSGRGATLPDGLTIEAFDRTPRTIPGPDFVPFLIELVNCRTYWVRECQDTVDGVKCTWKEQAVCFGIRILPRFLPPFPVP